jgi:hypothetical protein
MIEGLHFLEGKMLNTFQQALSRCDNIVRKVGKGVRHLV